MNRTVSRSRKATAAVAAVAALALAACTPPNENPSDIKVDTATGQNPASLPGEKAAATPTNVLEAATASPTASATETVTAVGTSDATPLVNNCGATGLERPTSLTLNCSDQNDYLQDIVWDVWDDQIAQGTATRITTNPARQVEDTQVVLGNPVIESGVLVFDTISVDGVVINPESQL